MSSKKQSSITHIRSWVRTNGEMSEDGKSITYSCVELEAVIREAKAMHKEEIKEAYRRGFISDDIKLADDYYTETFGGEDESID